MGAMEAAMGAVLGNPDDQEYPVPGQAAKKPAVLGTGPMTQPQVGAQPPVSTTMPVAGAQPVLYKDALAPTDSAPAAPATPAATPATAPAAAAQGPWGAATDMGGWIDQQLKATGNTTDDPNYWRTQMTKDPKAVAGDPGAIAWWKDAIDRADGSALVASGQLQKRGAGSQAPGQGGGYSTAPTTSIPGYAPADGGLMGGALGVGNANSLFAQLMARANQSLTPDAQDPIIKAQTDAFRTQRTQGDRNTLSQLAEQNGANGNLDAATRSAGEQSGQATSQFQAGMLSNEVAARRQEIQAALSGAQGLLTAEQTMALQEEEARLDRAQQESQFGRSLNENESQFGRTLGQNAYQFDQNDAFRNSPLGS